MTPETKHGEILEAQAAGKLDFGSLNDHLRACDPGENLARSLASSAADDDLRSEVGKVRASGAIDLTQSAGPISDAYILSTDPVALITGPGGSAKTTSSNKKALLETARIYPGSDGVRHYVLGAYRQNYKNLWSATIPSWWKIFPQDLAGSHWTGAKPRPAEHVIPFEDKWGRAVMVVRFEGFGDMADPEDLLGKEFTDCYLNEMSTFEKILMIGLMDRVGREPPRAVIRRSGKIFGDANAPDVLNYCYTDFYEATGCAGSGIWKAPNGFTLYRQPGGLDPGAENIKVVGREYYLDTVKRLGARHWRVKRMVHALPGFTRDNDPVYEEWDDQANLEKLDPVKSMPVVVGIDGGFTPSAVYTQVISRQARVLGEVVLERGGPKELAEAMLEYEARRFGGLASGNTPAEFADFCDPAMGAGEDLDKGSDRASLARHLGRDVTCADTNDFGRRREAVREYLTRTLDGGRRGLVLDPSCIALRRGFNQTYHFARTRGTNDLSRVEKTPDSHPHDGLQYAALAWGSDAASRRASESLRELNAHRRESRDGGRRNPLQRALR